MIYVDELRPCGAPWRGGIACHLVSDQSVEELVSFAASIGLPAYWCRRESLTPHMELSPAWRERALRAGARAVSAHELARITLEARRAGRLVPLPVPPRRPGRPA